MVGVCLEGLGQRRGCRLFCQVKVWAGKRGDKEEMGVLGAPCGGRVRRGQLLKGGGCAACMQDREAESRGGAAGGKFSQLYNSLSLTSSKNSPEECLLF